MFLETASALENEGSHWTEGTAGERKIKKQSCANRRPALPSTDRTAATAPQPSPPLALPVLGAAAPQGAEPRAPRQKGPRVPARPRCPAHVCRRPPRCSVPTLGSPGAHVGHPEAKHTAPEPQLLAKCGLRPRFRAKAGQ